MVVPQRLLRLRLHRSRGLRLRQQIYVCILKQKCQCLYIYIGGNNEWTKQGRRKTTQPCTPNDPPLPPPTKKKGVYVAQKKTLECTAPVATDLSDPVGRTVGDPHHSVVVLHPLVQELPDPPPPVRGEEEASLRVELLDGADEAHRGVLLEVRLGEPPVGEASHVVLHDDVHQAKVAEDCSPPPPRFRL